MPECRARQPLAGGWRPEGRRYQRSGASRARRQSRELGNHPLQTRSL